MSVYFSLVTYNQFSLGAFQREKPTYIRKYVFLNLKQEIHFPKRLDDSLLLLLIFFAWFYLFLFFIALSLYHSSQNVWINVQNQYKKCYYCTVWKVKVKHEQFESLAKIILHFGCINNNFATCINVLYKNVSMHFSLLFSFYKYLYFLVSFSLILYIL